MSLFELALFIFDWIKTLELIPYNPPTNNIGAWRGQLVCNSPIGYACKLTLSSKLFGVDDKKKVKSKTVNLPTGYIPSIKDKVTKYYTDFVTNDKFTNQRVMEFLCYTIGFLYIGKNPATVNIGRGKIINEVINKLELTDLEFTAYKWSAGGSKEMTVTLDLYQVKALCAMQVSRYDELIKVCGNPDKTTTSPTSDTTPLNPDVVYID